MKNYSKKNSPKILTHRQKLWIQVKTKITKTKYTFNPNSNSYRDFDLIDIKTLQPVVPEIIEVVDWIRAFKFDWSGYRYDDGDTHHEGDKDNDDELTVFTEQSEVKNELVH